jgi:hypothetical protein
VQPAPCPLVGEPKRRFADALHASGEAGGVGVVSQGCEHAIAVAIGRESALRDLDRIFGGVHGAVRRSAASREQIEYDVLHTHLKACRRAEGFAGAKAVFALASRHQRSGQRFAAKLSNQA